MRSPFPGLLAAKHTSGRFRSDGTPPARVEGAMAALSGEGSNGVVFTSRFGIQVVLAEKAKQSVDVDGMGRGSCGARILTHKHTIPNALLSAAFPIVWCRFAVHDRDSKAPPLGIRLLPPRAGMMAMASALMGLVVFDSSSVRRWTRRDG